MEQNQEVTRIAVSDVVYRQDLYPRIEADAATIQRYAENLEMLPPIEINQNNILIDGYHRWTAHRKAEALDIAATVTVTESEAEVYALAIKRNSQHGLQMNNADKKKAAIRLYAGGTGLKKEEIADSLSVTERTVRNFLGDIDKQLQDEQNHNIASMWLACYTQEEIADALNIPRQTIGRKIESFAHFGQLSKMGKTLPFERDADFTPPLYNVWTFAKKSNSVTHFGSAGGAAQPVIYWWRNKIDSRSTEQQSPAWHSQLGVDHASPQ